MPYPVPIPAELVWSGAQRVSIMPPVGHVDEVGACDTIVDHTNLGRRFTILWDLEEARRLVYVSLHIRQLVPHALWIPQDEDVVREVLDAKR